ncbi:50S ribosomal protein L17 [candidate division WWE3 bacterium RIFCSPLOWO2_01_FULL_39_13]|uniref:Large ribosomal subunit protein bL17 n=1 Tax=candidate division WWE3 bacterium RIFCSPLOWO2_01_FULL_39_13 TaxID=1802624 RepID=A0A1F4V522_UNCKA|nr:MAG: 50S ribosomal protein L17 [candidate division WWE3 bacterium RIFCSPLOWO2_01_FULL_39_13]
MRHRVKGKKFSRNTGSRKALLQGLIVSLFDKESIETSLARAKYMRPEAEKMITMARRGDLASRRILISRLQNRDVVHKLIDDIGVRFKGRPGGYTRIQRTRVRKGDVTEMAQISLIERPVQKSGGKKMPVNKKAVGAKNQSETKAPEKTTSEKKSKVKK